MYSLISNECYRFSYSSNEVGFYDDLIQGLEASVGDLIGLINSNNQKAQMYPNGMEHIVIKPVLMRVESKSTIIFDTTIPLRYDLEYNKIRVSIAEAFLKGGQKLSFIRCLVADIKKRIRDLKVPYITVYRDQLSVFVVCNTEEESGDRSDSVPLECIDMISRVPGVSVYCPCYSIKNSVGSIDTIYSYIASIYKVALDRHKVSGAASFTFRITVNLKGIPSFDGKSHLELNGHFGHYIIERFGATVDLSNPICHIFIDIYSSFIDIFDRKYSGLGGLPLGSEGDIGCIVSLDNLWRSFIGVYLMSLRGCNVICYIHETLRIDINFDLFDKFKKMCLLYNPYIIFKELPSPCTVDKISDAVPEDLILVEQSDKWDKNKNFWYFKKWKEVGLKTKKIFACASIFYSDEEIESLIKTLLPVEFKREYPEGTSFSSLAALVEEILSVMPQITDLSQCIVPVTLCDSSSTEALGLLSGGIDSPVAMDIMSSVLGINCNFIHFSSSIDKFAAINELARVLSGRNPGFSAVLYIVNFQRLQDHIANKCPESYRTLMYKIFFVKIAAEVAQINGYRALVTGNCMGQVSSQTAKNMLQTDLVTNFPIISPLLGANKDLITAVSRRIGTFEASTSGCTDDCCIIYLPQNPVLSAKAHKVKTLVQLFPNFMDLIDITERRLIG